MTYLPRRLLAKVVTFRSGEATTALLMFAYSFLAMTSYNIVKPATRSKFIAELGSDNLPYVQLAAGLFIGVLMHGYSRASDWVPRRVLVPLTQAIEVVILLLFWVLFQTDAAWVPVAFYVAGLLLGVLLISQFWTLANDIYDPRQAKRLFGFIGGGASLGGAMGSGLTRLAVEHVGTNNLLLVSSALLACCVLVVWAIAKRQESWQTITKAEERAVGGGEALRLLGRSRHLQIISLVIASATIGATIIDQQLNMAAEAVKGAESTDAITGFLAEVTFYTSVIGFVIQVGLTSRIHRFMGIGFALLMLPLGLGTTATIILLNGALWAPAAARVLDSSLRYTVDKTTREVLFLPLPAALKYRAKPFIDVTVDRLAKALGAILILVLIKPWGLALTWQQLSFASLGVTALWIFVALAARREYLFSFRKSLGSRSMTLGTVRLDAVDAATVEALVEELASPDESAVLYAIDLLETLDRRNLITPLLRYHPSAAVRARALGAVSSADGVIRGRWATAIEAMLADEDADVRAAAVRALSHGTHEEAETVMRRFLGDADPRVVVTAATVLSASSRPEDVQAAEAAIKRLVSGAGGGDPVRARLEVASGLARIDQPALTPLLVALLRDADPTVAREAIKSARARAGRDPLVVPALVALLADRVHKRDAREALVAAGQAVVAPLVYFLRERDEATWVRRHLPATVARIGTQEAMDALGDVLDDPDGFLRFKALEALESLHRASPALKVPGALVEKLIFKEAARLANCLTLRHNLAGTDPGSSSSLLARTLDDKAQRIIDRVYRLLGLVYAWTDISAARFTIEHGTPRARAGAIEYLDNLLAVPLRRRVLPLLDIGSPDDRVRFAYLLLRSRARDLEETVVQLIHDDDQVVSAAALHLAARRNLTALADDVEYVLARRVPSDRHVLGAAAWALAALRTNQPRRMSAEPAPAVDLVDRIKDIPLFRGVHIDEVFRLVDVAQEVGHQRGHAVIPAGAPADSVLLLVEGAVVVRDAPGQSHDVAAPAALAVEDVLSGNPVVAEAVASDRTVVLRISRGDFLATVADSAPFARALFGLYLTPAAVAGQGASPATVRRVGTDLQPLDKVFLLREHPLFGRTTVDQCLQIVGMTREIDLTAGTVILDDLTPPAIHIVVSGAVRLEAPGQEPTVAGPGRFIGVAEALGGRAFGWRGTVTEDGRAIRLETDELLAVLGEHPELLRSLLSAIIEDRPRV